MENIKQRTMHPHVRGARVACVLPLLRCGAPSASAGGSAGAARTSVWSRHTAAQSLLRHCAPRGQQRTHLRRTEPAPTAAPSVWDVTLPSGGHWRPLSGADSPPYTQLQPELPPPALSLTKAAAASAPWGKTNFCPHGVQLPSQGPRPTHTA